MGTADPYAPYRPLSADEVARVAEIVRRDHDVTDTTRFAAITLREPVLRETAPPRQANATMFDRHTGLITELVVDLSGDGSVTVTASVADAMPYLLMEEAFLSMEAVRTDERWQAAMKRRGIDDWSKVQLDPWPPGTFDEPWYEGGRRITRVLSYYREHPHDNGYGRPIEGVMAIVDLATEEVVEVVDTGVVDVPTDRASYYPGDNQPQRADRRALDITQPDGPSFTIDGYTLRWQGWSMSVSLHPVQGLVLHRVTYTHAGTERSVLHRAALSEMVVPYGDTDELHRWKNAFDCGEWGLGRMTNSLTLGCDCLGEVHYLDGVLADEAGNPWIIENAICIHEEDFGILWKHHDLHSGTTEVRRRRRFVVSAIHTVGNYEYAFYWYFYEDGTIGHEAKMTGILQTKAVPVGTVDPYATTVAPGVVAPHHQHLFSMRLEWDLDGGPCTVSEVDVVADEGGASDPYVNGFRPHATVLETESQAVRTVDPATSRSWLVTNRSVTGGLGQHPAFKLLLGAPPTLLGGEGSMIRARAGFATANLWVTPYDPSEMRAAGEYPNQSAGGDGLPAFVAADREIVDTDVVTWLTFGITHIARPEDWPVMPTEPVGFTLLPFGFFDRNPTLDVAPSPANHCHTDDA
ncbi:MAG TPA: primary-amine oxidase [Acidimicrobiales bacterium]